MFSTLSFNFLIVTLIVAYSVEYAYSVEIYHHLLTSKQYTNLAKVCSYDYAKMTNQAYGERLKGNVPKVLVLLAVSPDSTSSRKFSLAL